jgi:hypothetical protein
MRHKDVNPKETEKRIINNHQSRRKPQSKTLKRKGTKFQNNRLLTMSKTKQVFKEKKKCGKKE